MLEHRVEHQLLIALIDNISELVVFFNSDGEIILFNQRAKKFFNIDTSQIANLRLSDLASTLKIDQLTTEPINSLKEKLPIEQIETTYTANNTANYIIWSIYDLKQQRNERDIFILLGKDVTDLKNLSSNMEKLDNIIKYAPEMIYWKNTNSIYLGCNDQFAFAANLQDRNDIIGKSDYELPWHIQAKKFCSDDKEVIVTGNPKLNIEDLLQLKDGKQGVVITNKVPLRDLNGAIIGVLGIATDITERKKSETALQQSKSTQEELERLNNIIRYAPDFIYWKDKNSIHLGCNDRFAHTVGYKNREDIIGKSDFDFPWKAQAEKYKLDDEDVIKTGTPKLNIPDIVITADGQELQVISNKVPLCDSTGAVIGVLGITTDITHQKQTEHDLKDAKEAAELALQAMKQAQIEEQKHREKAERLAVENAKHKTELEAQAAFTGTIDKAAHDIGSPMSGLVTTMECLGGLEDVTTIDGYSVALISEPERQKSTLYLQKKDSGLDFEVLGKDDALEKGHILWDDILMELKKNTLGDASDVPVFQKECLGILLNILINKDLIKAGINEKRVPEDYRIQVRDAIEKIKDITEELISRYTNDSNNKNESKQLVLIATVLNQLISEKRMGFLRKGIELKEEFSPESLFAFVNIQSTQVNRAISNIMNNAAQAFDGKPGNVILKLRSDNESVYISICDNGKGMTPEMVEKIKNKIAFTEGKKDGHGIGLSQVRDTLEHNHGKMTIESEVGVGTTFTLAFSKKIPPAWAIDKIQVTPHDIILILDDDNSIHGAWDLRFKPLIKKHPSLKIEHFTFSAKLLDFLATVPEENKKNLFLLTDYELLNQQDNGVQVMQQTKIKRSTLVTSHYAKTDIQNQVMTLNAKLLPKQLASFIPVVVSEVQKNDGQPNHVDAVWLDDEPSFTSSHEKVFIKKNKKVDIYRTPQELKDNLHLYSKETPVFLDNNFAPPFQDYHGTQIAKELHDMGFSKLSLITGEDLDQDDYPYLKIIKKHSLDDLTRYF